MWFMTADDGRHRECGNGKGDKRICFVYAFYMFCICFVYALYMVGIW